MYRKTYLEINENNICDNIKNIKLNYPDYKYYFGVVKANAYGHGVHIVNAMIDGGINYLAVSSLEEALDIRKYNKTIPILCFGYIDYCNLDESIKNNVTITIHSYNYYKKLIDMNFKEQLKVHIKLNTGMNRFGITSKKELKEIVEGLSKTNIFLEGIYTHYATSGVLDIYWDKQTKRFEELTSLINLNDIPIVHLYNSLSLVKHNKLKYANGVRLGLVMYGYSSSASEPKGLKKILFNLKKYVNTNGIKISQTHMSNKLKLKKAFNLYSEVISVDKIKKGEAVGYKSEFVAPNDCFVATIPIGHADGITKYYKQVKINDKFYKIVALCMDYIIVLVDKSVKLYDKVTLIDTSLSLSSIASNSQISIHQALISITNRVPRVHIYNDDETEIKY